VLCAIVFCAIVAQGAAAQGTTAFTCKEKKEAGGVGFSRAHCTPADAVASGAKFEHVEIANGVETEITGNNENTGAETVGTSPGVLNAVIGGVGFENQCPTISGTGTMANSLAGEEMIASGTGTITFSGCTVVKPVGQECKIKGGEVATAKIKVTTAGQTEPMFAKIEPAEGTTFGSITYEGCKTAGLNGVYSITGSIKTKPDGSTVKFTEAETTEQGTLKLGGQKAGIGGVGTLKGRKAGSGEAFTALGLTTK
jgi:hypothetical protein